MQLKTICLNLWIGGILLDKIISFLQNENADFLLLQEVYHGQDPQLDRQFRSLSILLEQLNYPYFHFAPAFLEAESGQLIEQGNAILSKYPLEEAAVIFYDEPFGVRSNQYEYFHLTPRNLQHVMADVKGKKLHLLNTQGIWGLDGGDSERRLNMSQKIVAEVEGRQPLILAGDFNLRPETKTIANIEKQLTNVFKDELKTSFNIKRKDLKNYPGYAEAVVDMFFVSAGVAVVKKSCPAVDISDHLPLVVELKI